MSKVGQEGGKGKQGSSNPLEETQLDLSIYRFQICLSSIPPSLDLLTKVWLLLSIILKLNKYPATQAKR